MIYVPIGCTVLVLLDHGRLFFPLTQNRLLSFLHEFFFGLQLAVRRQRPDRQGQARDGGGEAQAVNSASVNAPLSATGKRTDMGRILHAAQAAALPRCYSRSRYANPNDGADTFTLQNLQIGWSTLNGGIENRIQQLGEAPTRDPYRRFYCAELAKELH